MSIYNIWSRWISVCSVSQWMRGSRSTGEWYDIRRERYSNIAIDYLIKEDHSRISSRCSRVRHPSCPIMSVTLE